MQISRIETRRPLEEIILEPPRGWLALRFNELWTYRELLYFFVWREIKVRYKQTVLGAAWAVLQPLLTMVIFSIIFGRFARLPSDGIPYPLFSFAALLPWQLFSRALADASMSLVNSQQMITKVYFPRIFLPAASVLSGLLDFGISFVLLLGMMYYYGVRVTWALLLLPVFLLLILLTAMAIGMWLSALNVRYRDFKYITPFLLQFWQYATPIAYSSSLIPQKWQLLYNLNPLTGVINGFRWALLGQQTPINDFIYVSMGMVAVLFIIGLIYFQRTELTFADVI